MNNFNDNNLKPEQSWLKAEKMLDTHFRKKRILTWALSIFISGVVVVGSVMVYHFSGNNSSPEKNRVEKNSASFSLEEKDIQANLQEPTTSQVPPGSTPVELNKAGKKKVHAEKTIRGQATDVHRTSNKEAIHSGADKKPAVVTDQAIVADQQKRRTMKSSAASARTNSIDQSTSSAIRPKNSDPINGKENSISNTSLQGVTDLKGTDANSIPQNSNSVFELALLKPIQSHSILLAQAENNLVTSRNENPVITLPESKFNLQIAVYGGSHYMTKKINSKNYTEYIARRTKEEEGIVSNSFGVSLSHEIKNSSIGLGFEYSTWGEKKLYLPYVNKKSTVENGSYQPFDRVDSNTIYFFGIVYFQTFLVQDSNFVSRVDTVIQQAADPSISSTNNTNRFSFFELPVEYSYRFMHGKISIGATAGISPAWLIAKKGYILKRDLTGLESISEMKSLNEFVLNGKFSIDLFYKMNERINVLLRPQFKTNLNSLFESDYDVNQRYSATGLLFGLQYVIR